MNVVLEDLWGDCRSSSELPDEGGKSLGLGYGRAFEGRTNHLALIANKVISLKQVGQFY